ncbi:MAG: NTE family protein [Thalassolituus oleivorans]|jgi:NTE family protein
MYRLLPFLFLPLVTPAATAQTTDVPKVGLVLSGGGAKGLAHIGVLKVLEEEQLPIDVIAGTSMGAIVGGLYAAGFSAQDLVDLVTNQDWKLLFSDTVLRSERRIEQRLTSEGILLSLPIKDRRLRIPGGLVEGQEAMTLLTRLTWGYHDLEDLSQLPIPFVALATDLQDGSATPLGDVTLAQAIRASLSLPTFFSPARIGNRRFLDGGLSRNLPATDALALGADLLIGVDVGELTDSLRFEDASLLDILAHASWYQGYESDIEQRELIDILIRPDVRGMSATSLDTPLDLIARGEAAARAALPAIRAMVDSPGASPRLPPTGRTGPHPAAISEISIRGVDAQTTRLVAQRLRLDLPAELGPADIEPGIARVYGTGLFRLVTYRVVPNSAGAHMLIVNAIPEEAPDRLRVGVTSDTYFGTQVLLSVSLRSRVRYGSTTEFRWRIGEQSEVAASYFTWLGQDSGINVGASLGYAGAPVRLFLPNGYARAVGGDPDVPVLGLRFDLLTGELFAGFSPSESVILGLSARAELVSVVRKISGTIAGPGEEVEIPRLTPDADHAVMTIGGVLRADTFDRRSFPSRGSRLFIDVRGGKSSAGPLATLGKDTNDPWIRTARLEGERFLVVNSKVSLFGRALFSFGKGEALPLTHYTFLGGAFTTSVLPGSFLPLYGSSNQERFGRKAWMGLVGAQVQLDTDVFARVMANVGETYDVLFDSERTSVSPELFALLNEKPSFGAAVELGARTPVGPASLILSSDGRARIPEISLTLGYRF